MTYLGRPALSGCGCSCRGTGACKGMGDDSVASGSVTAGMRTTGAPTGTNPVLYLRAQLNRYTAAGGAPYQFQYAATPLALSNDLDADTANRALWVLNMRAGYAALSSSDPATRALLATYSGAWSNPAAYVSANLSAVTDVVRLFADANKLPPAKGVPIYVKVPLVGDISQTTVLIGGGALVAAIFLTRRRRR